jgi:hypothetical protein
MKDDMTDIEVRLHAHSLGPRMLLPDGRLCGEAADEIKRLRAALLVAQQWMPTPQQALVPSAKADAELVERALTGRKD